MSIEDFLGKTEKILKEKAEKFGGSEDVDFIFRNNTNDEAFEKGGAYFGLIRPEEENSGKYHDFSFVLFPLNNNDKKKWCVSFGVGSLGFKNDQILATRPGLRRKFNDLYDKDGFCKTDFSDLESYLSLEFRNKAEGELRTSLDKYKKLLPVCQYIEFENFDIENIYENNKKAFDIIFGYLAAYADIRGWASNDSHRDAIKDSIEAAKKALGNEEGTTDDIAQIKSLVGSRKFVVLEGPPGTGKTRAALEVANTLTKQTDNNVFFTQFHAETTYSDFIYGIRPSLKSQNLKYKEYYGDFVNALIKAIKAKALKEDKKNDKHDRDDEDFNVILIIDEINRANLSNILGPIFYLFEYQRKESSTEIPITPDFKIKSLPENFYVIATMNTADRSLAVVDFALRRRFAWYNMKPKKIEVNENNNKFFKDYFVEIDKIFQWHATSDELNLQPGHAYFIAEDDDKMRDRLRYEIFPLIKEYLAEGYLQSAKEEFENFFNKEINKTLFE